MLTTREEVLIRASTCSHAAHLYVDDASLIGAVGAFAGAAIGRGEAAALIAAPDRLRAITSWLNVAGHDCEALAASRQLVRLDAVKTLAQIMDGPRPSRAAFDGILRPIIVDAKDEFGGLAAFGELVNILWQQRDRDAAHVLETWWNELIAEYGFSLLCSYRVDVFDFRESIQQGIDTICSTHTHLVPVVECERLERAVNAAMRKVFHNGDAAALREHLLRRCGRTTKMPPAQAALLALRDILPSLAQDVRMIARDHYRRADATATSPRT